MAEQKCKWCGRPEATVEGTNTPFDAFCWATINMGYCDECDPDSLLARALKAEARVAELEAVVARTADGVTAKPGMSVWVLTDRGSSEQDTISIAAYARKYSDYEANECYSTSAAALAAKEAKQ